MEDEIETLQDAGQDSQQPDKTEASASIPLTPEEYSALNEKTESGYEPSEEEWERIESYHSKQSLGNTEVIDTDEVDDLPETKTQDEGKLETAPEASTKSEDEVAAEIVETVRPNMWTQEQVDAINAAMSRVGAKDPRDIADKIKGLQSLASKKGGEARDLETQYQQAQEKIRDHEELMRDLQAGIPGAYEYLKQKGVDPSKFGIAKTAQEQQKVVAKESESDDDIIDPVTHSKVINLQQKLEEQGRLMAEITRERELHAQETRREGAIGKIADQVLSVANEFRDLYHVNGVDMRGLIANHLKGNGTDPRIAPVVELMKFARDNDLPNLRVAHIVKNEGSFGKAILAAEERGRKSVLGKTQAPAMSSVRDSAGGKFQTETHTEADVERMVQGQREMPDSWFNEDGSYNTQNIPAFALRRLVPSQA